ncbi:uncharacterized protein itprid1 isoform X2 [Clupea harengus]|uniref:Uncharacterized protein itprid1 isoform X2 n=1 Tax=Clupea harengus TaxID=7950 RepID=A0A6P8GWT8_CLUHA|nr:uncharacterized protein itprid1 isoform X2 [Clupea harengus]
MAADPAVKKRANLLASRASWAKVDGQSDEPSNTRRTGDYKQDSVQQWLSSINRGGEKNEAVQRSAAGSLQRNASAEDDLALGVEASIYGNPGARTVKEFLRSSRASAVLPRWNSLTSAFSSQSNPLSVMDVLNLWEDDPAEVLLDLGFGVEEPDITGRIPARFINHQSQARGINLQVFLDAQKNRMDIENPDVRNRFRQLEVLHQVTTAFNSLVGGGASAAPASSGPQGPQASASSPEAREKRKRMGMLLRRASKKTLSLARASQEQAPPPSPTAAARASQEQAPPSQEQAPPSPTAAAAGTDPEPPATPTNAPLHPSEKRGPLKRFRSSLGESGCLTPLVEEQGISEVQGVVLPEAQAQGVVLPEAQVQAQVQGVVLPEAQVQGVVLPEVQVQGVVLPGAQAQVQGVVLPVGPLESPIRLKGHREPRPLLPTPPLRKRSPGEPMESFELEEIQSFDEGSMAGSASWMADSIGEHERGFLSRAESCVVRTNSCQSDSSGFLEEPFVPATSPFLEEPFGPVTSPPPPSPGLMKALNAMSGSTDSLGTLRGSPDPSPTSPTPPTSIFTSPSSARDPARPPAAPSGERSSETPPVLSGCPSVDVAAAEDAAEFRENASAMGASQCCQNSEGVPCADVDYGSSAEEDVVSDGITVMTESSGQRRGEPPLSELDNVQEQHVREGAISKDIVVESSVCEEGVSVRGEHLTGEVTICDEVVSVTVSVKAVKEVAMSEVCSMAEEEALKRVVGERAVSECVLWKDVASERAVSENTASQCAAEAVAGAAGWHVVSKGENVSNHTIGADATVDCALSKNELKDYQSTALCCRVQGIAEHTVNECGTIISSRCGIAVESIALSGEHQAPGEEGLSFEHTDSQVEAQSEATRTPNQDTQVSSTEASQPADSDELKEGTLVESDGVFVEPSGTDRKPRLAGRSVTVQMCSSLAPISQTLRSSDVTQRRNSFSRRAWSEAEVSHTLPQRNSQTLAMEIPELASSIHIWQSQDSSQGFGKFRTRSASLDTGLSWEDGDGRLDGVMMAGGGGGACLCQCQCPCCSRHGAHVLQSDPSSSFPYSLDELEEMMQGVKRFRTILTEIEQRLDHEQASVYEDLSATDREEVGDVLELRAAVKQEARKLELQLTDLVHHYDDSFKMKINRLLDEQSHLCSQLRIHPSGRPRPSDRPRPEPASTESVAIQCSLLPVTDTVDTRLSPHHSSNSTKQAEEFCPPVHQ